MSARTRALGIGLLTATLLVCSVPPGLTAQAMGVQPTVQMDPTDCEVCEDGVGEHRFLTNQGILCAPEDPDPDCRACDLSEPDIPDEWFCHNMYLSGTCAQHHLACTVHFASAEQQLLVDALGSRDVRAVATIIDRNSSNVVFNAAREAIQWTNCHGALVGHIPVVAGGDDFLHRLGRQISTTVAARSTSPEVAKPSSR